MEKDGRSYVVQTIVVAVVFFGVLGGFNTAQSLVTSLEGDLGAICLATLYITFTIACLVAPKAVNSIGPKMCMLLGGLPYILMILSNLKDPAVYLLSVPAYFLVGVGAPLLWTGQMVYISRCALQYAARTGVRKDDATSTFNGLFMGLYQLNGAAGGIVSSLILANAGSSARTVLFLALGVTAFLGWTCLFWIKSVEPVTAAGTEIPHVSLTETLRVAWMEAPMRVMIVIIYFNGVSLGFWFGSFPANVISPSIGATNIGYVMTTFFVTNTLATWATGYLATTCFGRRGITLVAALCSFAFSAFCWQWKFSTNFVSAAGKWTQVSPPSTEDFLTVFAAACVFGIADSVWESQIPAILQSWFKATPTVSDAAMANVKMWQSLGFATNFAFQSAELDFSYNALVLLGLAVLGTALLALGDRCVMPLDEARTKPLPPDEDESKPLKTVLED